MKPREELTDEELKQALREALSKLPRPGRIRLWLDLLSFKILDGVEDLGRAVIRMLGAK